MVAGEAARLGLGPEPGVSLETAGIDRRRPIYYSMS